MMNKEIPHPDDIKYIQDTLYAIGGKWKLPILYCLSQGSSRFNEIEQSIPDITPKMLSKELRELELNGFVEKKESSHKSEYEITSYCKSFEGIISEMILWGKKHRDFLKNQ